MGLDMYFHRGHAKENDEIFYFRKHSDLHGFLTDIWLSINPGKNSEDFNCEELEITKEIVDAIEIECKNLTHKKYSRFFWGSSYDADWERTKEKLIPLLRNELNEGNKVYYMPWW